MLLLMVGPLEASKIEYQYLEALDCRHPEAITSGLINQVCTDPGPTPSNENNTAQILVLQKVDKHVIQGYRCELRYSKFEYICGFSSHAKPWNSPTIEEPQLISPEACVQMRNSLTYEKEDGNLVPIRFNQEYQYKYTKHGRLIYSSDDVDCEGATIIENGEQISSIIETITAKVIIKEIKIEVGLAYAVDLDNNVKLPSACSHQNSCQDGTTAYVLEHPSSTCPYSIIRNTKMKPVKLSTDNGMKDALVDDDNKLLLTLGKKGIAPAQCRPIFSFYATEYEDVKVVTEEVALASVESIMEQFDPSLVNLELELKTSESYITYFMQNILLQQMRTVTNKMCSLNSHSLELAEISPFHPDSLLRVRGDVIQELKCKMITVKARLGEKRTDHCSSDSLPIWVNNQPLRIQARTHLVVEEDSLEQIPCNAAYMPVFLAKDGKTLITADPEVKVVNIALDHLEDSYLHLDDDKRFHHPAFGGDLLYTRNEMDQFNDLIHFQRTRKRVVNALVSDYCEGNAQCGPYQPGAGTSPAFSLQHLEDQISSPFQIFFDWSDKIAKIGNVCAILIVFVVAITIVYKLCKVLWLNIKHGVGFGKALKLGLFVDTMMMNAIISPRPARRPRQPAPEEVPLHQVSRQLSRSFTPTRALDQVTMIPRSQAVVPYFTTLDRDTAEL